MGNCLRHGSSIECVDDEEWGLQANKKVFIGKGLLGSVGNHHGNCDVKNTDAEKITEVKIKITKKQLEQLLKKVDANELSVHQVFSQLIQGSHEECQNNQRRWRPALQSIPEMN